MIPKSDAGRRIALFPGSFNPFTRGHESLVTRALSICNGVTIAIGINIEKMNADTESRVRAIREFIKVYILFIAHFIHFENSGTVNGRFCPLSVQNSSSDIST